MFSVSFQPIGSWPVVALAALVVTWLTIWAYLPRLRTTTGNWRWIALGLRLAAVLLCLIAALRPSVVMREKEKQPASLVFLLDDSTSMKLTDEANGKSRWEVGKKAIAEARSVGAALDENLSLRFYRFDKTVREDKEDDTAEPAGRETAIGSSLLDALAREAATRVAYFFVISDGTNNAGIAPLVAARQLKGKQIPVVTIGLGSETAGAKSRDIAIRDLVAGPTVFVKNQLQVKGTLMARGFANQTLELEMLVEGQDTPVATQRIRVPEGTELIPITGLKYVPQTPGEKRITLRVKPREGELVQSNNEVSTFIRVLKGGINGLFIQGPRSPWEHKYLTRAIAASPDIQVDLKWLRKPVTNGVGELQDTEFVPGRYDVYILSDLPSDFLTPTQQALLAQSVEKGAGLIMLGGLSSFGDGGWGGTEVARVLPVTVRPGDGQLEPEGGVRFVQNPAALENYIMQVGSSSADSARIWKAMPALTGINHLGSLKARALVLGQTESGRPEPIMVGMEVGSGRSLAFGGETWHWARSFEDEIRVAHRRFWRQIIFWLAHKEDEGQNEVKLVLDSRRISVGQKLDLSVTTRDEKGSLLSDVRYETQIEAEAADAKGDHFKEKVDVFNKGEDSKGTWIASQAQPGIYKASVVATHKGKEVGRDSARFLIYNDDKELEQPAADRNLLRVLAESSGGEVLAPEQLGKFLKGLKGKVFTETYNQHEYLVWDNWPFFLLFTTLLVMEWFVRKRHGLV